MIDPGIFGAALGAVAAIGGAMVVHRLTRTREREMRLWDKRIEAYFELFKWIREISNQLGYDDYREYVHTVVSPSLSLLADVLDPLLPESDLEAKVRLYGSPSVQESFKSCTRLMIDLITWDNEMQRKNVGYFLHLLSLLRNQLHKEMTIKQGRSVGELFDRAKWRYFFLLDRLKLRELVFYKPGMKVSFPDDGDPDEDDEAHRHRGEPVAR